MDVKCAGREPGATDLKAPFQAAFSAGFFDNKPDFDRAFEEEPPLMAAQLGAEVASAPTEEGSTLRVLHCNLATAPAAARQLHARLHPLLLFFVDAASAIDADDPNWELLLAVETSADGAGVEVVGFATLYNFWVCPDQRRVRVSQVLVLPPHQGRGAGSLLLRAAYSVAEKLGAVDIPVRAGFHAVSATAAQAAAPERVCLTSFLACGRSLRTPPRSCSGCGTGST